MRYIIDRFEGSFAVCETEQGMYVNIEKKKLPKNAKEGDVLLWKGNSFVIDVEATKKQKEKIKKLSDDLWI